MVVRKGGGMTVKSFRGLVMGLCGQSGALGCL